MPNTRTGLVHIDGVMLDGILHLLFTVNVVILPGSICGYGNLVIESKPWSN
jgi:hypothetical protein